MNVAIIPARGGSKRIPRKNIKDFCGKPMISHVIKVAKASNMFDHVIVSTDDNEIANIATYFGAEVPFIRPSELSGDHIATAPVIAHAINECSIFNWEIKNVCCIYPCAPFIQSEDLKEALNYMESNQADFCFPITPFPSAIQRGFKRLKNGKIQHFFQEFELTRTQDLDSAYYDAGQFYWGKTEAWKKNINILSNGLGYEIPNWRVVDIDNDDDWKRAEIMSNFLFKIKN